MLTKKISQTQLDKLVNKLSAPLMPKPINSARICEIHGHTLSEWTTGSKAHTKKRAVPDHIFIEEGHGKTSRASAYKIDIKSIYDTRANLEWTLRIIETKVAIITSSLEVLFTPAELALSRERTSARLRDALAKRIIECDEVISFYARS